jgi:hypothetical protein
LVALYAPVILRKNRFWVFYSKDCPEKRKPYYMLLQEMDWQVLLKLFWQRRAIAARAQTHKISISERRYRSRRKEGIRR